MRVCLCGRLLGLSVVRIGKVLRSGKQQDKNVPMELKLTDPDSRPSQVIDTVKPRTLQVTRWSSGYGVGLATRSLVQFPAAATTGMGVRPRKALY